MMIVPIAQPLPGHPSTLMHPGGFGLREGPEKRRLRAVIVEDEFIIALELEMVLGDLGVEVVGTAGSVERAVELAEEARPDFLTMDIKLPSMRDGADGITAATEIFQRLGIRSIFVSAYKDAELLDRARAAQPLGWVRKPISIPALRAALPDAGADTH